MTVLEAIKGNKINHEEVVNLSGILFDAFEVKKEYKDKKTIKSKELVIEGFIDYLKNNYLNNKRNLSRNDKLTIIKVISKLKLQLEVLEMNEGKLSVDNIRTASKRLNKKSQSAFD